MSTRPAVLQQHREQAARPTRHMWEFGRLIVRTPTPPDPVLLSATSPVDDAGAATDTGGTVTATRPADMITDRDQAAHHQRTLPGRLQAPHHPLVRIRTQTATGLRCARATEG